MKSFEQSGRNIVGISVRLKFAKALRSNKSKIYQNGILWSEKRTCRKRCMVSLFMRDSSLCESVGHPC